VFTENPLTLVSRAHIGYNVKFLLTLTYRKGHQGSFPGGHSFVN